MNFTVLVSLLFSALSVVASSPAEGVTRVEILAADGITVVASQDSGYSFVLPEGAYTMRMSLIDVNGNVIGVPFTQALPVNADVATREVQVPTGATVAISVTPVAAA